MMKANFAARPRCELPGCSVLVTELNRFGPGGDPSGDSGKKGRKADYRVGFLNYSVKT